MPRSHPAPSALGLLLTSLWLTCAAATVHAEPAADLHVLAQKEQQPLLDTLRDLVNIESGSKDIEADWVTLKCGNYNKVTKKCSGQNY